MKLNSIFICLLLAITANSFTAAKAQVNTTDSLALVDLYNSTNGPHWTTHTNWLTKKPVSTWFGITVTGSRVVKIDLTYNGLNGALPASIGDLTDLTYLNLSSNQLTGTIPVEFGNLTNLIYLILHDNQLSGTIPASVGSLTNLGTLGLASNKLSGTLPASIGNLANLTYLNLQSNQISGTIPASIGNLHKLNFLNFGYDQFSGAIPAEIGNCTNLTSLTLNFNHLSGNIPAAIGNLTNLGVLYLKNNQLTGVIPVEIGNLVNLAGLNLSNNQLSGAIPAEIGNMAKLTQLQLYGNQLTGTIPTEIGNLVNLGYIFLYNNRLTGNIPASFRKLHNIQRIDVSHNLLSQDKDIKLSLYKKSTAAVNILDNLFTFNGLEHLATDFPNAVYAPQDTILPIYQTGNSLSVSAGGTLSNNTYYWYKIGATDSTIIKGDSTFTPSASGKYYAKVTNAIATQLTLSSDTISYTTALAQTQNSIANVADVKTLNNHFSIHPNPAKDVIHIQVNGTADIIFTNSAGKILLTKSINNSGEINASSYANGVYYIQNKTTGEVQKLIVVH